jgi:Protein of unknown function (DUF4127)
MIRPVWRFVSLVLTLCCALALFTPARGQQSKTQLPKLKPVPMNPGPLGSAGYLVLTPIDDRPAVGQFAQMVGAIADHRVTMPPRELLGRFTTPGDTARIEQWLRAQDYSKVDALIVSADMLCYGGLVASRRHGVSLDEARKRLEFFRWFKQKHPRVPVYVFSTIMRVAPTATAETRTLHDNLARWAELKDRAPKTGDAALAAELERLTQTLGPRVIDEYLAARRRNLQINLHLLDLLRAATIKELILLQDDAREFGLHRQDQAVLKQRLTELGLELLVPIYNGADEGSISLVSRAVLDKFAQRLRVAVIYSSEKSRSLINPYEDHPLQFTVESQIRAAGGEPVGEYDAADYTLFVNAPGTTDEEFDLFTRKLIKELKQVKSVALADLLFPKPHFSGADERLIAALARENLLDAFVGYAAWNTAGNTLGTAIPHANMRVFFRAKLNDGFERAARATAAHMEFLLHRYVGDYLYHTRVRPELNRRLREVAGGTAGYELTPQQYESINREAADKLRAELDPFFAAHFRNRTYPIAIYNNVKRGITVNELKDLQIRLPWPRTFEAVVEYKLDYSPHQQ